RYARASEERPHEEQGGDEAEDRERRTPEHAPFPTRVPHERKGRQGHRHDDGLPDLDPGVESEEREQESVRRQSELPEGRREAKAVHETEAEADEPAAGYHGRQEEVLGGHERDGQRDDRLHEPGGEDHDVEHGEGERDAVSERERRDDLDQRQPATAPQEEPEEKEQVIPAAQDVLDPEQ